MELAALARILNYPALKGWWAFPRLSASGSRFAPGGLTTAYVGRVPGRLTLVGAVRGGVPPRRRRHRMRRRRLL